MAFIKNSIPGNARADCEVINENLAEIFTELEAFPAANGALKDESVTVGKLKTDAVTIDKLSTAAYETTVTGTGSVLPVSGAIKDYVDNNLPTDDLFGSAYLSTGTAYDSDSDTGYKNITFDTVLGGQYTSNYFTIPVAGKYRIMANVTWTTFDGVVVYMRLTKNGALLGNEVSYDISQNAKWVTGNDYYFTQASVNTSTFAAGDKIRLQVKAVAGSGEAAWVFGGDGSGPAYESPPFLSWGLQ
jgi:hypothetical protein